MGRECVRKPDFSAGFCQGLLPGHPHVELSTPFQRNGVEVCGKGPARGEQRALSSLCMQMDAADVCHLHKRASNATGGPRAVPCACASSAASLLT